MSTCHLIGRDEPPCTPFTLRFTTTTNPNIRPAAAAADTHGGLIQIKILSIVLRKARRKNKPMKVEHPFVYLYR
jgi:hypothetical protein